MKGSTEVQSWSLITLSWVIINLKHLAQNSNKGAVWGEDLDHTLLEELGPKIPIVVHDCPTKHVYEKVEIVTLKKVIRNFKI